MTALTYSLDEGVEASELREEDQQYLSDDYKRDVLQHMSIMQLIDTIMINPTVHISPSYRDTGLSASYTFQPLSNLVYTRDQQITTCKGIVMGRLRSSQRQLEVEVMKFCFRKLGTHCYASQPQRRLTNAVRPSHSMSHVLLLHQPESHCSYYCVA